MIKYKVDDKVKFREWDSIYTGIILMVLENDIYLIKADEIKVVFYVSAVDILEKVE